MNIKNLVNEMFIEIVKDYENEKMIENKGCIQRTTACEFLGGRQNV